MDEGGWRSAHPSKDHRCGALTPPAILAADKQRRLCLTDRHRTCATYTTARALAVGPPGTPEPAVSLSRPAEDGSTVTRWSLVRTAPVVLDAARVPVRLGAIARQRPAPQLMLGGVMVIAFVAVALTRMSEPITPASAGLDPTSSPDVTASAPARTQRPTPPPSGSTPPSVAPSASVPPTSAPTPTPRPGIRSYTVRAGDTLYALAIRYGTTVQVLRELNAMGNSSSLRIGQVLRIP
jgi:LysM repeat protein